MEELIGNFGGEYHWLSNFYNHAILYKGIVYLSTESAYQAHKSLDEEVRLQFKMLTPRAAKELGQKIEKREDWERVKGNVMYEVLVEKFKDRVLRKRLLDTGDAELVEGNWWHDNTWGDCICSDCMGVQGLNMLGRTLMRVRQEIRDGKM